MLKNPLTPENGLRSTNKNKGAAPLICVVSCCVNWLNYFAWNHLIRESGTITQQTHLHTATKVCLTVGLRFDLMKFCVKHKLFPVQRLFAQRRPAENSHLIIFNYFPKVRCVKSSTQSCSWSFYRPKFSRKHLLELHIVKISCVIFLYFVCIVALPSRQVSLFMKLSC